MTVKRKVILQQKKTGTTSIDEGPLNQVIDEWIEIWDAVKEKEESQKLSKAQQTENASMAAEYRANLLKTMHQKKRSPDSEQEEEIIEVESSDPTSSRSSTPIPSKKRRRKPRADDEISKKMMDTLEKVGDALIKETEAGQTDGRIDSLAKEVKEMKENLDKQQNQLALILSLLQKEKEK